MTDQTQKGKDFRTLCENLHALDILVVAFDEQLAEAVGQLKPKSMQ